MRENAALILVVFLLLLFNCFLDHFDIFLVVSQILHMH
jgi:hypothetical protein